MNKEVILNRTVSPYKIRMLNLSDIYNGRVLKKRAREVYVEIPYLGVGRVYGVEYIKAKDLISKLKEGDEVIVKIIGLDDGYGNYELELRDVEFINTWIKAKELMKKKEIIELEIEEINRGGLLVNFEGLKGFVPLSQLAPENYPRVGSEEKKKIEEHLKQFLGKKMKLRIIDVDPVNQKLILSERAAKLEEYETVLKNLHVGEIIEVKVVGLSKFGIFVRVHENPHIDGLIHITEIPEKYKNLEDHFKKDDRLKAKIIKIEPDRISLSLRDLVEDPWISFSKKFKTGDIVEGLVIEKSEFFATIEIESVKGLVLENFENLEINQKYQFQIEQFSLEDKKLILKLTP